MTFLTCKSRGDTPFEEPWWHVYTAEWCGCRLTVSDCPWFSDINISKGSVARRLRYGGILNYRFIKIFTVKFYGERYRQSVTASFWQSPAQSIVALLGTQCSFVSV